MTCTMKTSLYLLLCCSLTLTLLVLITTTNPPPIIMQIQGVSSSLQDLDHNSRPVAAAGEAKRIEQQDPLKQLNYQGKLKQVASITPILRGISVRKLASPLVVLVPQHLYDADKQLYSHSKSATARKLLQHKETSTTSVTITPSDGAQTTVSANAHGPPHDEHNVNESTAFHVDYNGPKTHPPKNN